MTKVKMLINADISTFISIFLLEKKQGKIKLAYFGLNQRKQ